MIRQENIALAHDQLSAKEAMEAVGQLLLNNQSIHPQYIQNMLHSYDQLGPYFVIAPGIAIAHAQPDESVIKHDLALLVSKKEVYFNSHNDPVHLIFGLCAPSAHHHMDGLVALAELLSDDTIITQIKEANDIATIHHLIHLNHQGENV